jgi:hypothetical protein
MKITAGPSLQPYFSGINAIILPADQPGSAPLAMLSVYDSIYTPANYTPSKDLLQITVPNNKGLTDVYSIRSPEVAAVTALADLGQPVSQLKDEPPSGRLAGVPLTGAQLLSYKVMQALQAAKDKPFQYQQNGKKLPLLARLSARFIPKKRLPQGAYDAIERSIQTHQWTHHADFDITNPNTRKSGTGSYWDGRLSSIQQGSAPEREVDPSEGKNWAKAELLKSVFLSGPSA